MFLFTELRSHTVRFFNHIWSQRTSASFETNTFQYKGQICSFLANRQVIFESVLIFLEPELSLKVWTLIIFFLLEINWMNEILNYSLVVNIRYKECNLDMHTFLRVKHNYRQTQSKPQLIPKLWAEFAMMLIQVTSFKSYDSFLKLFDSYHSSHHQVTIRYEISSIYQLSEKNYWSHFLLAILSFNF